MAEAEARQAADETPDAVSRARQLLQGGKLKAALALTKAELLDNPDNTEALYIQAVAHRYLRQSRQALDCLEILKDRAPTYARAYQEEGHNLKQLGQPQQALAAYQRAVDLNHALIASWRELAALHKQNGNQREFDMAQAEYARLSALPSELVSVASLIQEGKLYRAEKLCRAFLQKTPHHVEAMRLLAMLGMKLFVYDDAEFLLESCVEFAPDYWLARYDYINVLHKRQKFEKALQQAKILLDAYPDNHAFQLAYANENVAVGNFDTALEIYDRVIEKHPAFAQPCLSRGHALKTIGRLEDAIQSYRSAYRAKPDFGDAFWSLANLKTYRFTDGEIEHMLARLDDPATANVDRFHLCFALGAAYEARGDYGRSFRCYERGNLLKKQDSRYDPAGQEAAMQRQAEFCTAELFASKAGMGGRFDDPIFIVGLPRAGSTLLEQILASHSMVDGTMELPNIIALAHRLNGRRFVSEDARYPGILAELSAEQLQKFADQFIEDTRVHRAGAPHFIDKMPNNFMHIGLIHLILPRARIIDARRHPMACCFSGFKQLFADGQEFTYGQEEIARYYKGYVRLMKHWDEVLPGKVLRVHYEHVVADLEGQLRRILDYLGLPFEENCLNYYQTDRSIRTPSSEQVRQPIYRGGLEQWRNFEPYLDVLKRELADEISRYPYSDATQDAGVNPP
jgi:tetratricopeptide (TPR) repeat protein